MIIVFFIKAPVFAKEKGKLFQWKQDKDFQAGVILASHLESVFLPRLGWPSGTGSVKGSCPSAHLPPHPGHSDILFLPGTFCQDTGALSSRRHDIQERNTLPDFYFVFQQGSDTQWAGLASW